MNNCKHKLTRNKKPNKDAIVKQPIELIQIYNLKYGDSNDVFENKDIRGTYTQLYHYAKSYFKKRYWGQLDNDSDDISIMFSIFANEWNTLTVDVYPQGNEKSNYKDFVDLVKENV